MKGGSKKGDHRNKGIPQGFVKFGSAAHRILKHIHECGNSTPIMLQEALDLNRHHCGMVLTRLVRHGFLYRVDKAPEVVTGEKTAFIYSLTPSDRRIRYQPLSAIERSRRARQKKKIKVPSVFAFRGSVPLTRPEPVARKSRAV
jgi:hypothetical protein